MFFIFNTYSRFPPFLLYVRCKSGVTFIRRSSRDALDDTVYATGAPNPSKNMHEIVK